jgi:hypothetical protein
MYRPGSKSWISRRSTQPLLLYPPEAGRAVEPLLQSFNRPALAARFRSRSLSFCASLINSAAKNVCERNYPSMYRRSPKSCIDRLARFMCFADQYFREPDGRVFHEAQKPTPVNVTLHSGLIFAAVWRLASYYCGDEVVGAASSAGAACQFTLFCFNRVRAY